MLRILLFCMQKDHVPDIVLFSVNCLANILDIAPILASPLVEMKGIGILTAKIVNF